MNNALIRSDLLAYSLQVGLLVAAAAFVPTLVGMRAAGARLLYWQLLLAACLVLPWVRPWHREVIVATVSVTTVVTEIAAPAPEHFHIAMGEWLLYLLAAGVVVRLAWLGVGFWRLRRYRRRAWPLENAGVWAEVLLSAEVSSPVTFGWRRPVILLPERFPLLSQPMRQAILCHENLHVERRDWLFTVAEEVVRAALWFHPAIWWLLAEIQLAREQAVDARVVGITRARDPYVDALLEMAGARPELDLAPAPLFLRKRHLKQRVVEIVREVTMSKTRWIWAMAASVVFLAGACWLVTGAIPLQAEPQVVSDGAAGTGTSTVSIGPGVSVSADQFRIDNGVTSTSSPSVLQSITVSGISDAAKADLLALLPVHEGDTLPAKFSDVMNKVFDAVIQFDAHLHVALDIHNGTAAMRISPDEPAASGGGVAGVVSTADLGLRVEPNGTDLLLTWNKNCEAISDATHGVLSISDGDRHERYDMDARQLGSGSIVYTPVTGDVTFKLEVTSKNQTSTTESVRSLRTQPSPMPDGNSTSRRIAVSGDSQGPRLISRVEPVYPALAKQARIQGTVVFSGLIGKDGRVKDLRVVRGHPLLVQAALEAVKQWIYQPTIIDGEVVEVRTEISVNFTLAPNGNGEAQGSDEDRSRMSIHNEPAPGGVSIRPQPQVVTVNAQPQLIYREEPKYPQAARQSGVQGTVVLTARIDRDGHVEDVTAVSGDPLLVQAAKDAVMQWRYRPALTNGQPVEAQTQVALAFMASSSGTAGTPQRIRVGGNVQAAKLVRHVSPKYPAEAKKAHIQGTVEMRVLLNKDGTVHDIEILRGDAQLAQAAQEAVQQWVYKPTLLNGEPVEVQTTIDVNFTLQ